jgi:AbrB family transcriptional regulator, transcriptional pleiotropic regulator of transition state genes
MKALGVVRNLDDLGRLVIPKEIRSTQGWDKHQPFEMFMSEEGLVIKPYRKDFEKVSMVNQITEVLENVHNEASRKVLLDTIKFIEKG